MGKIFEQPSALKRSYVGFSPPVPESKIEDITFFQGPAGAFGVDFLLANGLRLNVVMREADWHTLAAKIVGMTKENYLSAEDRGDPDVDPNAQNPPGN
jgi:hypothetical protein